MSEIVCICLKSVRFHFDKDNEFYVRNECVSTLTKMVKFMSEISASVLDTVRFHFDKDNEFYVRN